MVEEYCWAITHSAGRSCRGRSRSSVSALGSQLFVVPACVVDHTYSTLSCDLRRIRLVPPLPKRRYVVTPWGGGGEGCL